MKHDSQKVQFNLNWNFAVGPLFAFPRAWNIHDVPFMPYAVALLCGLSVLVGQYLYGGIFRPALIFPSYLILIVGAVLGACYLVLRKQDAPSGLCAGLMCAFVGWMLVRICFAERLPQATEFLQLFLGCFLIYLSLAYVVVQTEARMFFMWVVLGGAVVQAVLAGGQFFGVWGGQPQGWIAEQLRVWYDRGDTPNVYRRAHGFYINGNHLVWLLNAAGFIALSLGAFGRSRIAGKILWIYLGAVFLAISLACLSRGGLLALGAGMFFIFILSAIAVSFASPGRRIASYAVLIGAFAIPAGVVFFIVNQNVTIQARATMLFDEGYRPQVWAAAFREFQLFPWLGGGPGAFTYFAREFRLRNVGSDDYFAHNDWLQLAADYGFLALALGILVVVVHLAVGCRAYVRLLRGRVSTLIPQSNSAAVYLGAATATVAFSIHSLFDFNLQLPANALLAAACLGILANTGRLRDRRSTGKYLPVITRYSGPVLLLCACLWLFASVWANRSEFKRLMAENYMLLGEYDLASQIAEETVVKNADSSALRYIVGLSRQRLAQASREPHTGSAQLSLAIQNLQEAVRLAPSDRTANIELARSLMMAGKRNEAKKVAFEVIRLEPRQVIGYELYGSILEVEGDIYSARRVYQIGETLWNTEFLKGRLEVLGKNVESLP